MSYVLAHTFTNDGKTWEIYARFDTLQVQTINDPPPQIQGADVDENILGFAQGEIISQVCSTLEQYKLNVLKAQFEYPYAYFEQVDNSPLCGYVQPSCSIDYTLNLTNSINGANNGRLEVVIAPNPNFVYRFSLDNGATFQTSPIFNGLFAGVYNLIIQKTGAGGRGQTYLFPCNLNVTFEIQNTVVPVVTPIPIPYQDTKNICYYFKLIINNVETTISEPIGWDAVEINGERDREFHGWQWGYSDGEFPLRFDCDAGGDLIADQYDAKGNDGEVQFKYGYSYFGTEYDLFTGKLDLNTFKRFQDRVEAVVVSDQFDKKLLSRLEVPVSMKQNEGYDGTQVTPPDSLELLLHAKKILTQFQVLNNGKTYSDNVRTEAERFYILFDLSDPVKNDIQETNTYTLLGTAADPAPDQYVHRFSFNGVTDLNFSCQMNVDVRGRNPNIIGAVTATARVEYYTRTKLADGSYLESSTNIISNEVELEFPPLTTVARAWTWTASKTFTGEEFNEGDEIYIYGVIRCSENLQLSWHNIEQVNLSLQVSHVETSQESTSNVWFLDDAMRHMVSVISDNVYVFRSTFFERANSQNINDGQASKRVLTNGFQVRKFDPDERPLKIDLKTVLQSLNAQNCIGVEYTKDLNGISKFRVERRDFFYQENQIIAIENDIEDYYEEVAVDLIHNEIEIGYDTYLETGFNSLDEFNTKHKWLTPIKTTLKKLGLISKFITSGYSIEDTRRQQFDETPTNSYDNDDNPFMIVVRKDTNDEWVTEKDEPFSTATDVISPETSYNLRLDPKRMLYNWFIWLKGIFAYKETTELIRNTEYKQNGDLTTQFDVSEMDVIGDLDRALIEEKENITLAALTSTPDIWRPEYVNLVCRLSPDKIQLINNAMNGLEDVTKNYGYIMVKKPNGVWQAFWLYDLKYNHALEKATMKGLKKFESPAEPVEDCCPWLTANSCYLLANGNRIIA